MSYTRRTKIVATVGPASSGDEILASMISGGVDVLRLNFSHGTREEHVAAIRRIRDISTQLGRHVAIMQDLCGPKIRIGRLNEESPVLSTGARVHIVRGEVDGTSIEFSVSQDAWIADVAEGDRILLNDGAVELIVQTKEASLVCEVVRGGPIGSGKGVNLPDTKLSLPSVTEKDLEDLSVGIAERVDFVALSFVRGPDDLSQVREILTDAASEAQLIAKIEKPEAIVELEAIIAASDGILVARGDLGVETALERVPFLQKDIVRKTNMQDKYVIVATQMLESMAGSPVPTRAEVSDVANAILDGADAVMLSVETSAGKFPLESFEEMARIARFTDEYAAEHRPNWNWAELNPEHRVLDAVGHAVQKFADDLNPAAIVTNTTSGGTSLFVSKNRPACPIIAFTESETAARRMRMFWGVCPVIRKITGADALADAGKEYLLKGGAATEGEVFLSVYSTPGDGHRGADSVRVISL